MKEEGSSDEEEIERVKPKLKVKKRVKKELKGQKPSFKSRAEHGPVYEQPGTSKGTSEEENLAKRDGKTFSSSKKVKIEYPEGKSEERSDSLKPKLSLEQDSRVDASRKKANTSKSTEIKEKEQNLIKKTRPLAKKEKLALKTEGMAKEDIVTHEELETLVIPSTSKGYSEGREKSRTIKTKDEEEAKYYVPEYALYTSEESFHIIDEGEFDPTCMQVRSVDGSTYREQEKYDFRSKYIDAELSKEKKVVDTNDMESQTALTGVHRPTVRLQLTRSNVCVQADLKTEGREATSQTSESDIENLEKEKIIKRVKFSTSVSTETDTEDDKPQETPTKMLKEISVCTDDPNRKPPNVKRKGMQTKKTKIKLTKKDEKEELEVKKKQSRRKKDLLSDDDEYLLKYANELGVQRKNYPTEKKKAKEKKDKRKIIISSPKIDKCIGTDDEEDITLKSRDEMKRASIELPAEDKYIGTDNQSIVTIEHKLYPKETAADSTLAKEEDNDVTIKDVEREMREKNKGTVDTEHVKQIAEKCRTALDRIQELEKKIQEMSVGTEECKDICKKIKSWKETVEEVKTTDEEETKDENYKQTKNEAVGTDITCGIKDEDFSDPECNKFKVYDEEDELGEKPARKLTEDISVGIDDDDFELHTQETNTKDISVDTSGIKYKLKYIKNESKKQIMKDIIILSLENQNKAVGTDGTKEMNEIMLKFKRLSDKKMVRNASVGTEDLLRVMCLDIDIKTDRKIKMIVQNARNKKRGKTKTNDANVGSEDNESAMITQSDFTLAKDISVETKDITERLKKVDKMVSTEDAEELNAEDEIKEADDIKVSKIRKVYKELLKQIIHHSKKEMTCGICDKREILKRKDNKRLWLDTEEDSEDFTRTKKLKQKPEKITKVPTKKQTMKVEFMRERTRYTMKSFLWEIVMIPRNFIISGQKEEEQRFIFNMVLYRAYLNLWATMMMILQIIFLFYLGFYWFRNILSWTTFIGAYYFNQTLRIGLKNSSDPAHQKMVKRFEALKLRIQRDKKEFKKFEKREKNSDGVLLDGIIEETHSETESDSSDTDMKKSKRRKKKLKETLQNIIKALTPSLATIHVILFVFYCTHTCVSVGLYNLYGPNEFYGKLRSTNIATYFYNISFGVVMVVDTLLASFPIKLITLIIPFLLYAIQYGICMLILLVFKSTNEYFMTFIKEYDPEKYEEEDFNILIWMCISAAVVWLISLPRYYINRLVFHFIVTKKVEEESMDKNKSRM